MKSPIWRSVTMRPGNESVITRGKPIIGPGCRNCQTQPFEPAAKIRQPVQEARSTSFVALESTSFIEAGSVSLKDNTARMT